MKQHEEAPTSEASSSPTGSAADLAREYGMMEWENRELAEIAERYSLTMRDSQAKALLWLMAKRISR